MLKKLYAMITRKMEHKFEELKIYFNKKLSSQEQYLTCTFHPLINDLKAEIAKEIKREVSKQHEKLVSQNKILQQQVSELCKLNLDNQANYQELEQYGRCLCFCIDAIPLQNNETSKDVLDSVKNLFELAEVDIPDVVLDRGHRIDFIFQDQALNKSFKGIIVRFTTFRHRRTLCRARSRLKGEKVRLGLTKSRYDLLINPKIYVKEIATIRFCYVNVKCRLKIKFIGEDKDDVFFSSMDELRNMSEMEI